MAEPPRFEELIAAGRGAVEGGELERALGLFDEALEQAHAAGRPDAADRAFCNRAAVAQELGQTGDVIPGLRRILTRNPLSETGYLAAYTLARAYDLAEDRQKANFYARIAREHATAIGHQEWMSHAHNLLGRLALSDSDFETAGREFTEALRLDPSGRPAWRAIIEDNLGYCLVVGGRLREGLTLLYRSLRGLRRSGARRYEFHPRLSLSLAQLERGDARAALRHGRAALDGAESAGDAEGVKAAYYLLGEAAKQAGDLALARAYFGQLQVRFYPDMVNLADTLLAVDAREMVNLKA